MIVAISEINHHGERMRINFERDGTKVVAKVVIDVPTWDARVFSCTFECSNEAYAGLLTEAMRNQLEKELKAIRQNEYEAGWKDKSTRKRPKKNWFASTFGFRNR